MPRSREVKRITPDQIRNMDPKSMRKLYTEYRDIAQKRVKALEKAGYGELDITASGRFPKLRDVDQADVPHILADMSRFLAAGRSRVGVLRKTEAKTIESLNRRGYHIPVSKASDFGRFMSWAYEIYKNKTFPPSDTIVRIFDNAERLGISEKTLERNFKQFMNTAADAEKLAITLEDMNLPENRVRISTNEVRRALRSDWGDNRF